MNIIKQLKDIQRMRQLEKLAVFYETTDADELVKQMQKDIKLIKKLLRKEDTREINEALNYSRIGAGRWQQ